VEPYILTRSGRRFDFVNPTAQQISIQDIAGALSKICRYTGHCKWFYSVAQHSVLVSQLVPRTLAFEALMHDAHEAYTTDVSSPLKRMLGRVYAAVEHRVDRAIRHKFSLPVLPKAGRLNEFMYRHGLPYQHDHSSPLIKKADWIALGIEYKSLMPADTNEWPEFRGLFIPNWGIDYEPPEIAEQNFLKRFYNLRGGSR